MNIFRFAILLFVVFLIFLCLFLIGDCLWSNLYEKNNDNKYKDKWCKFYKLNNKTGCFSTVWFIKKCD